MTSENTDCSLRIVLLGKTGAGKSASGNTILGRDVFEVTHLVKSTNKMCEVQKTIVGGKTVSIIDTPGLSNTSKTEEELKADIENCIFTSSPGPHVFLLVIKLGVRFTKEERDTMKWIQENFGEEAVHRTLIIFTHTDQLNNKPLEDYIETSNNLTKIVNSCGGRYHSFNNEDRKNQDQVTELLKMINTMMETHEHSHYTHEMFKQAQITKRKKEIIAEFKPVCAVTLLGAGILTAAKIVLDKASAERLAAVTGQVLVVAEAAVEKVAEGSAEKVAEGAAKTAMTVAEAALKNVAEGAAEKVAEGAAEKFAEGAAEKIAEGAAEKIAEGAAEKIAEGAAETVRKGASTAGRTLAEGGAVTGVLTAAATAAARAAAAAGRVATTGRVGAVAAIAAVATGAIVTVVLTLKQSVKR